MAQSLEDFAPHLQVDLELEQSEVDVVAQRPAGAAQQTQIPQDDQ